MKKKHERKNKRNKEKMKPWRKEKIKTKHITGHKSARKIKEVDRVDSSQKWLQ